jgi:hypothetical protein
MFSFGFVHPASAGNCSYPYVALVDILVISAGAATKKIFPIL